MHRTKSTGILISGREGGFANFGMNRYTYDMPSSAPIRILFVDDDTSYMAIAQHLLSRYQGRKFDILWKKSGQEAIALLEGNDPQPDLVLMDYFLPEMNGMAVTKAIRERGIEIPIILLTSNRDFRLAIEAMKYGVEDYLVKDEAVDSVLPRTIVNIMERVHLKKRIAEQVKADLIAKKRTDAIKELVVTVCHEFNNPLAAIKISTEILLRQNLPAEYRAMAVDLNTNIEQVEKEITKLREINFENPEFAQGGEPESPR
jgi:CheY-like chemotaxis protein